VLLSDLLETVVVTERSEVDPVRARFVQLRFNFLPHKYYKQNFGVRPEKACMAVEASISRSWIRKDLRLFVSDPDKKVCGS